MVWVWEEKGVSERVVILLVDGVRCGVGLGMVVFGQGFCLDRCFFLLVFWTALHCVGGRRVCLEAICRVVAYHHPLR